MRYADQTFWLPGMVDHLSLLPESVDNFKYKIHYEREMSYNPAHDAAKYLNSQVLNDFSIVFRSLSMRLPQTRAQSRSKPLFWPILEELLVESVPPYPADGKWLLDNDPHKYRHIDIDENPDQPWDYEHGYAQGDILRNTEGNGVFASSGLAAQRMPRLRDLEFSLRPEFNEGDATQILTFSRDMVTGKARLEIHTGLPDYDIGRTLYLHGV
ncbi:hypothetical protein BDW69DRAFT_186656 [Aspergillus filifer]